MQPNGQKIQYLLIVVGILAIACLFSPFIFLKIGPKGYEYYGPDVPDIYILGGFILGKDIRTHLKIILPDFSRRLF
jgi:hypothetical protein